MRDAHSTDRSRSPRDLYALAATVAVMVAWNLGRRAFVPEPAHLPANLAMAFVFGVLGVAGGLDVGGFGLRRDRMVRGLAFGGAVFVVVLGTLVAAGAFRVTSGLLEDDRVHVGAARMVFEVLVAIPLGTVVLEELAFRGTLLGLLARRLDEVPAVAISAVVFGLWHVNGVVRATGGGIAVGAAIGTVAATTIAGVGFAWLRIRSGSLVAPVIAHISTNSLAFAVAWAYSR